MEDKRETRKELDLDQVEEATGGLGTNKYYKCDKCGKVFSSQVDYAMHKNKCKNKPVRLGLF